LIVVAMGADALATNDDKAGGDIGRTRRWTRGAGE
jgi:hypothetical protein